jgi:preprotein translocase subunit SecA
VAQLNAIGRPVLVGTRSVHASERLSELLTSRNLVHRLLNARQDEDEAQIVSGAGQEGCITVATNMAGRGTDIQLGSGVDDMGGLHVIATELHEARRIDRQLFGRCARQGDPGSCATLVSLEDELFLTYAPWLTRFARNSGAWLRASPALLAMLRIAAQTAAERRNARVRADTLKLDRRLEKTLAFSGQHE